MHGEHCAAFRRLVAQLVTVWCTAAAAVTALPVTCRTLAVRCLASQLLGLGRGRGPVPAVPLGGRGGLGLGGRVRPGVRWWVLVVPQQGGFWARQVK